MSLNIKNPRVHSLVRDAARITGKSQTSVVEEALRRYLDELARDDRRGHAEAILAELRESLAGIDPRPLLDDLYDAETGLPG
jgi:antitoxin VapB